MRCIAMPCIAMPCLARPLRSMTGRSRYASGVSRSAPLALMLVVGLVIAGCYSFAEPSFKPGDARDILMALARRGVEVHSSVTGAAACSDPSMAGSALRLVATAPDDATRRDIYIHIFRVRSWEESEQRVDACQAEYAASRAGSTVTRFDVPTYRAFGADWSPELIRAVEEALTEASQAGD